MTPSMVERVARAILPRIAPWAVNRENWTLDNLQAHGVIDAARLAVERVAKEIFECRFRPEHWDSPSYCPARDDAMSDAMDIILAYEAAIDAAINEGK